MQNVRFEPLIPDGKKQEYKVYGREGSYMGTLKFHAGEMFSGYHYVGENVDNAFITPITLAQILGALEKLNG